MKKKLAGETERTKFDSWSENIYQHACRQACRARRKNAVKIELNGSDNFLMFVIGCLVEKTA